MNTEQEYIDSILSIQNEIEFWENIFANFKGKHGSHGSSNRNRAIEKIQFFTEQKENLKKQFKEFLRKDLYISN